MDKRNNTNVYIAGMGHSGSTLLECLLGRHSQIASCGELNALSKSIICDQNCGCGKKVTECSVWKKVKATIFKDKGVDIFKNPYALSLSDFIASIIIDKKHQTWRYVLRVKVRRIIHRMLLMFPVLQFLYFILPGVKKEVENTFYLYDVLRSVQGKKIIVDSSKDYARAVELYKRKAKTKQKTIILIRDGGALLYSNIKQNFSKNELCRVFNKFHRLLKKIIKKRILAEDLIEIKYEDLAQKPEETLRKVCSFLNIDFQKESLQI